MAGEEIAAGSSGKLVIKNVGLMLSGDLAAPIVDADALVAIGGRISAVGRAGDLDFSGAATTIDANGVALAMSTERDTVVRVTYPDHVSWLTVAERFRSWIIAGLWLFATAALLFILQRIFRRRSAHTGE